jgi:hypothetical protein
VNGLAQAGPDAKLISSSTENQKGLSVRHWFSLSMQFQRAKARLGEPGLSFAFNSSVAGGGK